MSRVPELMAALAALPEETRYIEYLVHELGASPEHLAHRSRLGITEIRRHLEIARQARYDLAAERAAHPVVRGDEEPARAMLMEARQDMRAEVLRLHGSGMPPRRIATLVGWTVGQVYAATERHSRMRRAAEG